MPETVYLVDSDNDGTYLPVNLNEEIKPQPTQGKVQWTLDIYRTMKYPAAARQNGIEGVIILDVEFDINGRVTNLGVKKSVSVECDEEAKRAFMMASQEGYSPLILNGSPVKFKMEFPVAFWLD